MAGKNCIRKVVVINNENYYLTVGEYFVHITCPRENAPDMTNERWVIENLTNSINKIREGMKDG